MKGFILDLFPCPIHKLVPYNTGYLIQNFDMQMFKYSTTVYQ